MGRRVVVFLLQPPKPVRSGKALGLVPGSVWGVSRRCWGGWLRLPRLENGSERWVPRRARWAVPKSPRPLALLSCSPSGELALGWIRLLLGHLKVSRGSRASQLTEDKLSPDSAGCPWHQLMLATGEHPSPTLGL